MKSNHKMSILVLSFDGYSDLWPAFFATKSIYWPSCPYTTRLVSNYLSFNNVETIQVGKETSWSVRALHALDCIEEDYVMLLLEDYLFANVVNDEKVKDALNFMIDNNASYMRIVQIPKSSHKSDEDYLPLYENEEYGINLQASIWNVSFLKMALMKYSGSPWNFEIGFLSESVVGTDRPIKNCYVSRCDIIDFKNGVLKGKWFPSVLRYFNRRGINIDYYDRGKLSIFEEIQYNLRVFVKNNISYSLRKNLKSILSYLGVKFVSKY